MACSCQSGYSSEVMSQQFCEMHCMLHDMVPFTWRQRRCTSGTCFRFCMGRIHLVILITFASTLVGHSNNRKLHNWEKSFVSVFWSLTLNGCCTVKWFISYYNYLNYLPFTQIWRGCTGQTSSSPGRICLSTLNINPSTYVHIFSQWVAERMSWNVGHPSTFKWNQTGN